MAVQSKSNIRRIPVMDRISPDLALRFNADFLFDYIESRPEHTLELDFSDVSSISGSFAHQYLLRSAKCGKNLIEVNEPGYVSKMFEVVRKRRKKAKDRHPVDVRILSI